MHDLQERPSGSVARPARRRRPLWLILMGVGVVVVGLLGAGFLWWNQRGPSRPSISSAVDRFRSSTTAPTSETTLQPPSGVYIYAGNGEESLSFLATHQSQDGNLPGTVTRGAGGCWIFAIDYNTFHRQTWSRCAVDGRLVELGNISDQKFDFGAFVARRGVDRRQGRAAVTRGTHGQRGLAGTGTAQSRHVLGARQLGADLADSAHLTEVGKATETWDFWI